MLPVFLLLVTPLHWKPRYHPPRHVREATSPPSRTIKLARIPRACNNELDLSTMISDRSEVDTSSPFSSVKEAVAIFGERFLSGNVSSHRSSSVSKTGITRSPIYSPPLPPPKPSLFSANSSPHSSCSAFCFASERGGEIAVLHALRKLEAELCAMRCELKRLRERQAETKVALATLCLQLQRGMPKSATREIEAAAEVEGRDLALLIQEHPQRHRRQQAYKVGEDRWREERVDLPTLAQALRIGMMEDDGGEGRRMRMRKKKPVIPLIGDVFAKKGRSSELRSSLYSPSFHSVWG